MDAIDQLWAVARRRGPIDARQLLDALSSVDAADVERADERTKMLVRDAAAALRGFRATAADHAPRVSRLPKFSPPEPDSGDVGFPSLELRLMEPTDPAVLFDLLRDVGRRVHARCSLTVGGSLALMVDGLIIRSTEDIDVVDELPEAIRSEHALMHDLTRRYGLKLTHFQSHYLNEGWQRRVRSLGAFGSITAFRVDPIDVLVGKLFSSRTKDLDDVRLALPLVDRQTFVERVATTTARWRADEKLNAAAISNWYVISGEETLPPAR